MTQDLFKSSFVAANFSLESEVGDFYEKKFRKILTDHLISVAAR